MRGINIIFKDGTRDSVDPVLMESEVDGYLKIYNGWYTYSFKLEDIEKTEYYCI